MNLFVRFAPELRGAAIESLNLALLAIEALEEAALNAHVLTVVEGRRCRRERTDAITETGGGQTAWFELVLVAFSVVPLVAESEAVVFGVAVDCAH